MMDWKYWKGFASGFLTMIACLLILVVTTTMTGVMDWTKILPGATGSVMNNKVERKMREIQSYVDAYYLDEIDGKKMEDSISHGVMSGLGDVYAAYYNEEEYRDLTEKTSGNYCGIGAYVSQNITTGAITIIQPLENSPAKKAGLQAGDIIYQVEGEEVTGQDLTTVVNRMKGEAGTKVKLTIIREGKNKPMEFELTRAQIESQTVSSRMLDDKIGYIAVSAFEAVTVDQFREALDKLEKKGEKALIIDLRDNGGGLLSTAVDMLDRLLPEGIVVYTMDKSGGKKEYFSDEKESFDKPVAILINGNSASASEVFSGAMQDYEKAILVGSTTFGKGIVQSVFDLSDGTALKLTTSRYYTPKGRSIHGTGLKPDVEVELTGETAKLNSGITVDNQVKCAMDHLK